LGRTGVSQQTRDLLDFQLAHAQARDAVHARLETAALAADLAEIFSQSLQHAPAVLRLHSAATDRAIYLQRPDLGRRLDDASRASLEDSRAECDLALVVADGLSALAVERHALPLVKEFLPMLKDLRFAPVCVVEQGRVAIGDEIGQLLRAKISIVLIGERPGLSSPDSLGAYITWAPQLGRTDAERNCISNIRAEGLGYAPAAAQLDFYLRESRRRQLTGVQLKEQAHIFKDG
jgi:ethanolamine ammonia-lyase small subunit